MTKAGKTKEFAMNVHKAEFRDWIGLLRDYGLKTSHLRRDLAENLSLPTELIINVYNKKQQGDHQVFDTLVKCFSHKGFTTHYKILIPVLDVPAVREFDPRQTVDVHSVRQQPDGCCKFCRGFPWAGQVEVRAMGKDGEVPRRSQHKSINPYTAEEEMAHSQGHYDTLFRRWCRESRFDWIFEKPVLDGAQSWELPTDDPRLRHIPMMMRQPHMATLDVPKIYDGNMATYFVQLRSNLTKQDVAARILIDGIKREDPKLGAAYEKLDLERKRRQVRIDWLCVRRVKLETAETVEVPSRESVKVDADTTTKKRKAVSTVSAEAESLGAVHNPSKRQRLGIDNILQKLPLAKTLKRVTFAAEHAGPHINGQKPPAKGILKQSGNSVNRLFSSPQHRLEKFLRKKADATVHAEPKFREKLTDPMPKTELKPTSLERELLLPELRISNPSDPSDLRRGYVEGVKNSREFWIQMAPSGWNPNPALSKEENDAEHFNFIVQKKEYRDEELKLRETEAPEEEQRDMQLGFHNLRTAKEDVRVASGNSAVPLNRFGLAQNMAHQLTTVAEFSPKMGKCGCLTGSVRL